MSYKEALESMLWQFAHRGVKDNKPVLHTGGLSALEEAFEALGWPDPKEIEDSNGVICDVEGCMESVSTQGIAWRSTGYWCICSYHSSRDTRESKQPGMKVRAIKREASRGDDGCLPMGAK